MKDEMNASIFLNAFLSSFILHPFLLMRLPNLYLNILGAHAGITGLATERLEEFGHVREGAVDAETRRRVWV
jgi:hypothetical protein